MELIFSTIGAALIGGLVSVIVILISQRREAHDRHTARALENHLPHYESIFVAARSLESALADYQTIDRIASDRSDPFLSQLLAIVRRHANQYAVAVDWQHNRGMYYLPLALEEKCLELREKVSKWLAAPRLHVGVVASVRVGDGEPEVCPLEKVPSLTGGYRELRLEERRLVRRDSRVESELLVDIQSSLRSVIKDLKSVIAY